MYERIAPHSNVPDETARQAGTIIRWDIGGHEKEYVVSLPGLIGTSGTDEIHPLISRDLQTRLPDWDVTNRGSRLEIYGIDEAYRAKRDDELIRNTVLGYMDELNEYGDALKAAKDAQQPPKP